MNDKASNHPRVTELRTERGVQPTGMVQLWKIGAFSGVTALALWSAYTFLSPPRILSGDLICFKDPGINLAKGEGLTSTLDPANPTLEPKIYSNYPPLFPILYGGFVRAFGISPKVDECFDFVLSASAAFMFWFFITPRIGNKRYAYLALASLAILLLTLPIGPFWTQRERPDWLAFCLILLSVVLIQTQRIELGFLLGGFVAGLNWCLSPYGFVLNCVALSAFGLDRIRKEVSNGNLSLARIVRWASLASLGLAVPIGIVLLAGYAFDRNAVIRFVSNALGRSTGGGAGLGYFLSVFKGDFGHFISAFARYDSIRYKMMAAHLVVVLGLASLFVAWHYRQLSTFASRLIATAIVGIALIPVILFPYQPCYMSFTATVVVALLVRFALSNSWQPFRAQWIAVASVWFIALPAGAFLARELVLGWKAAPSYQKMDRIIASLEPEKGVPPPLVASAPSAYFSFKSRRFQVVNLGSLQRPEHVAQIDYFAVAILWDGPLPQQIYFSGWESLNLENVYIGRLDYSSFLLNPRFTYTWECSIYRQRKTTSANAANLRDIVPMNDNQTLHQVLRCE